MKRSCWCGCIELAPFDDDFAVCRRCGTLVSTFEFPQDPARAKREAEAFYGQDYWLGHMENDFGYANIYDRARSDLIERAPYWLRTLLTYKPPPGQVLELGSAHGGFVALMRWAGYDATGLELSPSVAAIGRELFQAPTLEGPVEDQQIDAGSLDAIVLMDVLEHLPDPKGTMRHCLRLLKPDGCLLIQTPKYPAGKSLQAMREDGDRFVEQLKVPEHLFLFTTDSIVQFFRELGCDHVVFEPAFFAHYDMFVVVSRQLLAPLPTTQQDERVMATQTGRLLVALLDAYARLQGTIPRVTADALEADRAARLKVIEQQGVSLGEVQRQLASAQAKADALESAFHASETDRAARLDLIEQQAVSLGQVQQELAAVRAKAEVLESALLASEADRAARLALIEQQANQLGEAEHHAALLRGERDGLRTAYEFGEADRAARLALLEQQGAELAAMREQLEEQRAQHEAARATTAADLAGVRAAAEKGAEELGLLREALADAERRAAQSLTRHVLDKLTQRRPRT